jgi:hypothetical protein
MNKYNDIEIQTAKNLLEHGYKWIVRYESGRLFAHCEKPIKVDNIWGSFGDSVCVCKFVPIFQSIHFGDKEPTSLEAIVHPPILDDAEREYLSAVIKLFRNEKLEIVKHSACNGSEEWLNFVREKGSFYLPNFKTGTMYKGMEPGHKYTLKELGL